MKLRNNGFTLIEILIVLVIISIVTAVALLTINHNQKRAVILTAEQLVHTLQLSEQKALLWPATLGLQLNHTNYKMMVLQKNKWEALSDRNLSFHAFSDNITFLLKYPQSATKQKKKPHIIFFENGEVTPFKILISKDNTPIIEVEGHANGEIEQHAYED